MILTAYLQNITIGVHSLLVSDIKELNDIFWLSDCVKIDRNVLFALWGLAKILHS